MVTARSKLSLLILTPFCTMFTKIKTDQEIEAMRQGGRMLATVLVLLERELAPGMTTKEAAKLADDELKKLGGEPAFLHYPGGSGVPDFPAVLCTSINDEVVHGIPSERELAEGDIVSVDFGVKYQGLITDAART